MKVTREEFKELVEICQGAQFMDKDDLINCLISWISDGLKLEEDELFRLMIEDNIYLGLVWGNEGIEAIRLNGQIDLLKRIEKNGKLED